MKKILVSLLILMVIAMAGVAYISYMISPVDSYPETIFLVESGATVNSVAKALFDEGIIRSSYALVIANKIYKPGSIKIGEYIIKPNMSSIEILKLFVKGSVKTIRVTLPEGYSSEQMAKTFEEKQVTNASDFLVLVKNPDEELLADFPYDTKGNLEGFLFPDTYDFLKNTSARIVIKTMLNQFENKMSGLLNADSSLTPYELVVLASIVEKEAKYDDERPRVAQVFLNRLKQNMKLQSCATIQYLLPLPKEKLLYKDLEIDSPYNTYKVNGLPPGPICSPGYKSLEACVYPSGEDYMYFVAMASGHHIFSKTYAEHLKAKDSPEAIEP